jgi:hypothetical protein
MPHIVSATGAVMSGFALIILGRRIFDVSVPQIYHYRLILARILVDLVYQSLDQELGITFSMTPIYCHHF